MMGCLKCKSADAFIRLELSLIEKCLVQLTWCLPFKSNDETVLRTTGVPVAGGPSKPLLILVVTHNGPS